MRTWMSISLVLFVLLTIILTILLSAPTLPDHPVTGMKVEVGEGTVRVTSGSHADTIHAGEIASIAADGQIRKGKTETGIEQTIADADAQSASIPQSATGNPPGGTIAPAVSLSATPVIEYGTKESYYIAGYVQGENGDFLANSQIICRRQGENRLVSGGNTRSNSDGYYILQLQEPGGYEVASSPVEDEYFEETLSAQLTETKKDAALYFVHPRGALTFKGRVIDKKGSEPIAGAEVRLLNYPQANNYIAVSGEDGRFCIKKIAEGTFNVFASADGYIDYDARERRMQGITEALADIHVSSDSQSKEYTIKMEKGGAVTVRVVDANQTPVSSVWVTSYSSGEEELDSSKHTDSNGIAEFTNIPPGKVFFQAKKEGYGETLSDIVETGALDAPAKVTVQLKASASISGRVEYQDGSSAEGWEIFVHNVSTANSNGGRPFISTRVKTGADGKYTIPGLGKGEYAFYIFKYEDNGRQRVTTDRIVALQDGEDKQGVDFVIEEGTETVTGIVLSKDGNPISGAKVMVWPVGGAGTNMISAETVSITDEKGEFSAGKLHIEEGGKIMVEVTAEGYKPFEDGFPGNEYVTVTVNPAEVISGVVRDQSNQQPISGANVILRTRFARDRVELTDSNGVFKFSNFSDGHYELFAFADEYAYSQIIPIDTESYVPANQIVLALETANEFRGIVADPSGKPVLGAIISLESRMQNRNKLDEYRGLLFTETSLSNENGAFLISNRAHQPDTLIIRHPQFALTAYSLPAEWDNDQPPVIYLNQGGSIEGVILNEEQNPIAKGEIHCIGDPYLLFGAKTSLDANGHYRIDRLPASNYHVHLYADIEKNLGFVEVTENQTTRADFSVEK